MSKSKKKKLISGAGLPAPDIKSNNIVAADAALTDQDKSIRLMAMILMVIAGLVFINTIGNGYTGDDYYITDGSEQAMKGISGIPEILKTHFVTFKGMGGSYRATGRVTFAIEHQFFGFNPHVGHFFNVVFYVLLIYVLFKFLLEVFGRRYSMLIFLALLFYTVHPLRSEVVASLKSRDELFSFLFSALACIMFVRYYKYSKVYFMLLSGLFFLLALMSKESSQQFLAVAPLAAYFSGENNWKKILAGTGFLLLVSVSFWLYLVYGLPNTQLLWMSEVKEGYAFIEHQLIFTEDPNIIYGTAFYGLLYYLRLLLFPYPLSCFYGYDLIPQVGLTEPLVILSMLIYFSAGFLALYLFKRRHILSFAILFYIITLSMFSNLLIQVAGVIADRFIFAASLGFCIIMAWVLLKVTGVSFDSTLQKVRQKKILLIIVGVIVLLFSAKSFQRNFEWKSNVTLAGADAERNPRSAMVHMYYAMKLDDEVLAKPSADSAAVMPLIIKHYKQVLSIYEPYSFPHYKIAFYYDHYYKNYNEAIKHMERAVDLVPANRGFSNYLFELYTKANIPKGQQLIMEHMLKYIPDAYEPHYFFGLQAFRNNNIQQSISSFETAMKLGARDEEMLRFMQDYYTLNNMAAKLDTLKYYSAQPQ